MPAENKSPKRDGAAAKLAVYFKNSSIGGKFSLKRKRTPP